MSAKKAQHGEGAHFVRAGQHVISLHHVVSVELPADGDEANTVQMKLTTGENFTLTGDDSDALLEALDECCDTSPDKPVKRKK